MQINRRGKIRMNFSAVFIIIVLIIALIGCVYSQNNLVVSSNLTFVSSYIPKQYEGYKVAHVTNMGNDRGNIEKAVKIVKKAAPDMIIVSGGFTDIHGAIQDSIKGLNELSNIADTYFVLQESDSDHLTEILSQVANAQYIDNYVVKLSERDITAEEYAERFLEINLEKQKEKAPEDYEEYINYISEQIESDRGKTIAVMGLNGYTDSVYEDKETVYDLLDMGGDVNILILGNIEEFGQLATTNLGMVFAGGTYGISNITGYTKGSYGYSATQLFVSGGVVGKIPEARRLMNFPEVQIVTFSDGSVTHRNPLEKLLDKIIGDPGTIFDNDGGFKEYRYEYGGFDENGNRRNSYEGEGER